MAKYISSELYNYWNKFFPELPRKTSVEDLWNIIFDNFLEDAAIEINQTTATMWFVAKGSDKRYEIVHPRSDIIVEDDDGGTKEERIPLIVNETIEKIVKEKIIKKPRMKRAKS